MKFFSNPVPEHDEVPLADDGRWEDLVEHWEWRSERQVAEGANAVYVLSVGQERDPRVSQAQLAEILSLVETSGDQVVGYETYLLKKINPRMLLGSGTAQEVADRARAAGADMLVIDAELSPSQARNLEDAAGISICDRESVILRVFLRNARTRKARIQVEIAHLQYLRPRIRGVGLEMDQQIGGVPGGRGPGETASELMARKLDGRLAELQRAERKLQRSSSVQSRGRAGCRRIALVGYTNAGKTSLMNALTGEQLSSRDRPFETLDTTSRALSRYGGEVLLSDTVGFIRRLPESLLASFESTLEEVCQADLVAVVVDLSDYEWREHLRVTLEVLDRLGARQASRLTIFNKVDLLPQPPRLADLQEETGDGLLVTVSSRDDASVTRLKETLLQQVRSDQIRRTVSIPYDATEALSHVYRSCRVLETRSTETGLELTVEGEAHLVEGIGRLL